jgi:hypothetical protein
MNDQTTQENQWKIVLLPRLQVDILVACFLLQEFGEEKFPGIKNAEYIFWIDIPNDADVQKLEEEGHIFLDMGAGKFDHHTTQGEKHEKCVSEMVAEHLNIHNKKSVRKLLEYARRDDIEGKGIISKDPIDRAFGLSGLVNNLNRMLPDDQDSVLRIVMPLFIAHHLEEKKRTEDFPAEYEQKLQDGRLTRFLIQTKRGLVNVITIETDEIGMAGYLRARAEINADIVVQKMSSGHVNIITQQKRMFDLSEIARALRTQEIKEKGTSIAGIEDQLGNAGRVEGVEEWYLDTRARTIQNGGIRPQWTTPTRLSLAAIHAAIKEASVINI